MTTFTTVSYYARRHAGLSMSASIALLALSLPLTVRADDMPMAPAPAAPDPMTSAPPKAAMSGGGMRMGMGMGMDMDDKKEMAGMMGMGAMSGGAPGAMPQSALPGSPGTSHLYHIGATDFFLDHPEHVSLTTEQQAALTAIKEKALAAKNTAERAIKQAEQELWTLTASDQPDTAKIQAKIAETEKLRGDERLSFIRAVGNASKVLTEEQCKSLTGFAPSAPSSQPAAADKPAMPPMKGM